MAIPKICGIENEFGFSIFKKRFGKLKQIDGSGYSKAVYALVRSYLASEEAMRYDKSQESRRLSYDDEEETPMERQHRKIIERLGGQADGFLGNAARFYLDVHHPEYSTPECLSPLDLVAHDKAGELIIAAAADLFQKLTQKKRYELFLHKNNSDGSGNSYGCHLNVLLSRKLREKCDGRYLIRHYMPFQIARMVLIGGGKMGAENGRSHCKFQISQRADFFENLVGSNTTHNRPIFNLRDEPHADRSKYFRLHDISTDSLMCEQAIFLKVALTQVVLSMIEDGFLNENLMPRDPVGAIAKVSRDLKFRNKIRLENRKKMTGLEILRAYLSKAKTYLSENPMSTQHLRAVEQAEELLDILEKDPSLAFGRLDWVTAWKIMEGQPGQAKRNLLTFREIYPRNFHSKLAEKNIAYRILTRDIVNKAKLFAPTDTKAYLRAEIIKKFGSEVVEMNWGSVYIKKGSKGLHLRFDDPALDKRKADVLLSKLEL